MHKKRIRYKKRNKKLILSLLIAGIILCIFIIFQIVYSIKKHFVELTQKVYCTSERLIVVGNRQIPYQTIAKSINFQKHKPLLTYHPHYMEHKIKELPFVDEFTIKKIYPQTIYIRLSERQPYAYYEHKDRIYLIDQKGIILKEVSAVDTKYPLLTGIKPTGVMRELIKQHHPSIYKVVKKYNRLPSGRWDLVLDNNYSIKLPQENIREALSVLESIIQNKKFPEQFTGIDLRVQNRIIYLK